MSLGHQSMDCRTRSLSERARQLTRTLLPRSTYAILWSALNWMHAVNKLGWRQSCRLWRAHPEHLHTDRSSCVVLEAPNLQYPFRVRPATTDASEFLYTIARETYGRYLPDSDAEFILDVGANIGDTAAWFLTRYQRSRLIAVEPDSENFELLNLNIFSRPSGA
jgi:hypothetical protein